MTTCQHLLERMIYREEDNFHINAVLISNLMCTCHSSPDHCLCSLHRIDNNNVMKGISKVMMTDSCYEILLFETIFIFHLFIQRLLILKDLSRCIGNIVSMKI